MTAVTKIVSDGSTASYYELPEGARELQDLISHRDMNAQMGEIFRATYRYGLASHSDQLRDAKKIRFYIEAEIRRLEKLTAPVGPRSAWIPHDGRGMPAYADTQRVEVRFVNGEMACGRVESYGWVWVQGNLWNIAEYRLLG